MHRTRPWIPALTALAAVALAAGGGLAPPVPAWAQGESAAGPSATPGMNPAAPGPGVTDAGMTDAAAPDPTAPNPGATDPAAPDRVVTDPAAPDPTAPNPAAPDPMTNVPADSRVVIAQPASGVTDSAPGSGVINAQLDPGVTDGAWPLGFDVNRTVFPPAARVAGESPVAAPIPPGTPVPHVFDVAIADLGEASPPPAPGVAQDDIDALLRGAQQWWSDQTGLAFSFTTDAPAAEITTTCDTLVADSMAAFGVAPDDQAHYTGPGRGLLVLVVNGLCRDMAGQAWTASPIGDVFAGGIFSVALDPPDERPYAAQFNVDVLIHEFGHAIGLLHSNLLDCGSLPWPGDDTIGAAWDGVYASSPPCPAWEYGDTSTIMGALPASSDSSPVDLSGLQRWYLGVGHDDVALVDAPTAGMTVALGPIGAAGTGQSGALVVPLSTGESGVAATGRSGALVVPLSTGESGVAATPPSTLRTAGAAGAGVPPSDAGPAAPRDQGQAPTPSPATRASSAAPRDEGPAPTPSPATRASSVAPRDQGQAVDYPVEALSVEYHTARDGVPGVYVSTAQFVDPWGPGLVTRLVQPPGSSPRPNPNGQSAFVTSLGVGDTFVSAGGSVRLTVVSEEAGGATVSVTRRAQPGVPGEVSITRSRAELTAHAFSWLPTSGVTYQWFADGQPIPGATDPTFVPPRRDANPVYRVEATFTAPGHAATTRTSRGIVVGGGLFTLRPPSAGSSEATAQLLFRDADGRPRPCAGGVMDFAFTTESGVPVTTIRAGLADGGSPGFCTAAVALPLPGDYDVTAAVPALDTGQWTDPPDSTGVPAKALRLAPFWPPQIGLWFGARTGPAAAVLVGSSDPFFAGPGATGWSAAIHANNGQAPAPVSVVVTNGSGRPVAGVPVTFHADAGLALSAPTALTDADGLAQVGLSWDPAVAPLAPGPDGWTPQLWRSLSASVAGFADADVAGSPQAVRVWRSGGARLTGWFEGGRTTAVADGVDAVTLHVRAFDTSGAMITGSPGAISARWRPAGYLSWAKPQLSGPAWDESSQSYVVRLKSALPESGGIRVAIDGVFTQFGNSYHSPPVEFTVPGSPRPILLDPAGPITASAAGVCADAAATAVTVEATALVEDLPGGLAWFAGSLPGGVVFSVPEGSPLRLTSAPVVERANAAWGYAVTVESSRPGSFPITVTSADGLSSDTVMVEVAPGAVDPAASSVSITGGDKVADGADAHVVTASLVNVCGAPLAGLGFGAEAAGSSAPVGGVGSSASAGASAAAGVQSAGVTTGLTPGRPLLSLQVGEPAEAGPVVEDPARPGTYTCRVTSKTGGVFPVQVVYRAAGQLVALPAEPLRAAFVAPAGPEPPAPEPPTVSPPGLPGASPGPPGHGVQTGGAAGSRASPWLAVGLLLAAAGGALLAARRGGRRGRPAVDSRG